MAYLFLKKWGIVSTLLVITVHIATSQDTARKDTALPFIKGRYLVGMQGSISSGLLKFLDPSTQDESNFNEYAIRFKTGYFIKDRWALGINASFTKTSTQDLAKKQSELFTIGPLTRYMINNQLKGALYLEFTIFYANLVTTENIHYSYINIDREYHDHGPGGDLGIGFIYTLNRYVGFDFSLNFSTAYLWATRRDQLNLTSENTNLVYMNLNFSFGFQVILDEFFF